MSDWSNLLEELLEMISLRLFSVVEIVRFRSICRSWRSIVSADAKPVFPIQPLIHLNPLLGTYSNAIFLPASYSRVTLRVTKPSSSKQGWLMKHDTVNNSRLFSILNPLSCLPLRRCHGIINLLECTVSEVHSAYLVQNKHRIAEDTGFKRVALVSVEGGDPLIVGIGLDGKIRYWNGEIWTRLTDQVAEFSDIIFYKGNTYALDSKGIIWWISPTLENHRFGPSIDDDITKFSYEDLRIVECGGELYIIDRRLKKNLPRKSVLLRDDFGNTRCNVQDLHNGYKTIGFEVYKMDQEVMKWVEVKSLGEYAVVMATDTCFSILAEEFYGCLENAIYFTDKGDKEIKVFKLDDGSIITKMGKSQSCFEMFDLFFFV